MLGFVDVDWGIDTIFDASAGDLFNTKES